MTGERLALTVPEAARALGIGRTLAYRLVASGELPSVRLGRTVRVPVDALRKHLTQPNEGSTRGGTNPVRPSRR